MSNVVKVYFQLGQLEGDYVLMEKGADVRVLKGCNLESVAGGSGGYGSVSLECVSQPLYH